MSTLHESLVAEKVRIWSSEIQGDTELDEDMLSRSENFF